MSKLEFIIKKDADKHNVELESMSLTAAKAFAIILDSLMKIADNTDNDNITVNITSGSAVLALEGPDEKIINIQTSFEEVISKASTNKSVVSGWRSLHELFSANGLEYKATVYTSKGEKDLLTDLKNAKNLRTKRLQLDIKSSVVFMDCKLIAVGGKIPNIHVETKDEERIVISCTEKNAIKAKNFLYNKILISAWVKEDGNNKSYQMCDSYFTENIFSEFQEFMNKYVEAEDAVQSLKLLHYKCREYIEKREELKFGYLRKFLKLFTHESTDINALKTILIVTDSIRENLRVNEFLSEIETIFDKKLKKYRKKKIH